MVTILLGVWDAGGRRESIPLWGRGAEGSSVFSSRGGDSRDASDTNQEVAQ